MRREDGARMFFSCLSVHRTRDRKRQVTTRKKSFVSITILDYSNSGILLAKLLSMSNQMIDSSHQRGEINTYGLAWHT